MFFVIHNTFLITSIFDTLFEWFPFAMLIFGPTIFEIPYTEMSLIHISNFYFIYFLVGKDVLQIWNIQLISYAGYKSEHDQNVIVGDPGNVSFTQFCQTLGWKGKGHSI